MGIFRFNITLPQIANDCSADHREIPVRWTAIAPYCYGFCFLAATVSVLFVYDTGAPKIKRSDLPNRWRHEI
jgi:hypothetical protein